MGHQCYSGSACGSPLEVPSWTQNWLENGSGSIAEQMWLREASGWYSRQVEHLDMMLLSLRFPQADRLDDRAFEALCSDAYGRLAEALDERGASAIRLWNFIPHILAPLGELEHRYMVFNAGRFRALQTWLGESQLQQQVATASGVGHFGDELVIHCLASSLAGEPVENPRQIPAYLYSDRYGPVPPCFARATRWGDGVPWLLVGGTASVRGEDSLHDDDLRRQMDETLYNLAAVVRAGLGTSCAHVSHEDVRRALHSFEELRVYHTCPTLREPIAQRLDGLLCSSTLVEFQHADLCREELLVEIEGIARLTSPDFDPV